MAQVSLSALGAGVTSNAASLASTLSLTTANLTALGELITNLSKRNDIAVPLIGLGVTPKQNFIPG